MRNSLFLPLYAPCDARLLSSDLSTANRSGSCPARICLFG